jgi:nucleotide-binding universal stress UspA family protein
MTTTTSTSSGPGLEARYGTRARDGAGPILVASDGSASADGAFVAAKLLAAATSAGVQVLSVLEAVPLIVPSAEALVSPVDLSASFEERRRHTLNDQMARVGTAGASWNADVQFGRPAAMIAEVARARQVRLIITGLSHHDLLERLFAGDTPVQVARLADAPVLAVPPGFARLPRTVVVAVDLTSSSVRAAAAARPLIAEATTVYLVHVEPRYDLPTEAWTAWDREYEELEGDAFAQVRAALELPADIGIVTTTLSSIGNPAKEVLRFAESVGADLIVAGHSHRSLADRILGGSVASRLYRGATCAILIVPDARPTPAVRPRSLGSTESVDDPSQWPALFRTFNDRNTARRVTLEVDDAELGAQAEARDYPLLGVDYDPSDGSVEIMLGDFPPGRRHLTHVVRKAVSVDVLRDPDGKDRVLHISREGGQTLLTLS